jgi:hypothetical protein
MDAAALLVDHRDMDQAAVVRDIREAEKAAAIGWRGAPAADKPVAALRELLQELRRTEDPKYESSFTLKDRMSQIVFLALCARYGLTAVRRKGERSTTFMARGPETFVEKVFWPLLQKHIAAITPRADAWLAGIVEECIHDDVAPDS